MKSSTASICARKSRSWRCDSDRQRLRQVLVDRAELERALDQRRGRAAEQRGRARVPSRPLVTFATGRIGAMSRTCVKSNGLATIATDVDRQRRRRRRRASSDMIPPRHQPTSCTGVPPASSLTARIALGMMSSTQCSRPRSLVGERDVRRTRRGRSRWPSREHVLGQRAAAAQVEADRRRGERRDEQHAAGARLRRSSSRRQVAVDGALGRLVDDPRGRAAQVGDAAAEDHVEGVGAAAEAIERRSGSRDRAANAGRARPGHAARRGRSSRTLGEALGLLDLRAVAAALDQLVGESSRRPSASTRWREPRWVTIRSRSPHTSSTGASIALELEAAAAARAAAAAPMLEEARDVARGRGGGG